MSKIKPIPPELKDYLSYDPETGVLIWVKKSSNTGPNLVGKEAGCLDKNGYYVVRFKGVNFLAHRCIWLLQYGEDPGQMCIDHINGNPSDNRICNLRLATKQQNVWNQSAAKGYYRHGDKFQARITFDGKQIHLGYHDTEEEARAAYLEAKQKYFGEFAPVAA